MGKKGDHDSATTPSSSESLWDSTLVSYLVIGSLCDDNLRIKSFLLSFDWVPPLQNRFFDDWRRFLFVHKESIRAQQINQKQKLRGSDTCSGTSST